MSLLIVIIIVISIILFYGLFTCLRNASTKYKKIAFKKYSEIYYYSDEDSSLDKKMKIKTKF